MKEFFEQLFAMKQEILLIIVLAAIAIMSVVAFILYGVDKSKAKREAWRIPEAVLLGWGFFGFVLGYGLAPYGYAIPSMLYFLAGKWQKQKALAEKI